MRTGFAFLDDGPAVLAFAHRGGARQPGLVGRENTAAAFAHAVALGYRYLETDVHLTRDGVLVAFHDALLERVTDGTGQIAELDSTALGRVRVAGREPVPTLVSLLESFPRARFNLDLKSDAAVAPLAELVRTAGLTDRVLVGSFSGRRVRRFRRLVGRDVATSASPAEVAAYVVLPGRLAGLATRALAGRAGPPAALQVPLRVRGREIVSARLLRRAHADGLAVHVWTVDDPDDMRRLVDRGVDGLMTDRTDILQQVLTERGLWPGEPTEEVPRRSR